MEEIKLFSVEVAGLRELTEDEIKVVSGAGWIDKTVKYLARVLNEPF